MKSDSVPAISPVDTITAPKLPSTARCDKQWACRDKLLDIHNFLPSATSLPPRATLRGHSTALKAQGLRRAWLSIPPPPATPITAPIVTAAVIPNPHTARTRKCTSKVINSKPICAQGSRLDVSKSDADLYATHHDCVSRFPPLPISSTKFLNFLTNFIWRISASPAKEAWDGVAHVLALFRPAFSTEGWRSVSFLRCFTVLFFLPATK